MQFFRRFIRSRSGATALEYPMIMMLLAGLALLVVAAFGVKVSTIFGAVPELGEYASLPPGGTPGDGDDDVSGPPTVDVCTPGSQIFSYTGSVQTFIVPDGCDNVSIFAAGAGGGGSDYVATGQIFDFYGGTLGSPVNTVPPYSYDEGGGAGSSLVASFDYETSIMGRTLHIVVGAGGQSVRAATSPANPFGGGGEVCAGWNCSSEYYFSTAGFNSTGSQHEIMEMTEAAGLGGGYSGVFADTVSTSSALVIAAGGGGAGHWPGLPADFSTPDGWEPPALLAAAATSSSNGVAAGADTVTLPVTYCAFPTEEHYAFNAASSGSALQGGTGASMTVSWPSHTRPGMDGIGTIQCLLPGIFHAVAGGGGGAGYFSGAGGGSNEDGSALGGGGGWSYISSEGSGSVSPGAGGYGGFGNIPGGHGSVTIEWW